MKRILLFFFCMAAGAMYSQYCTNIYSSGCGLDDDLDDFSLGSFSHIGTGCTSGGYVDYTSMLITVVQTIPQNLTVTTNYSSSEYLKLFIDYNSDQDFDDPGEEIYFSQTSFGSGSPINDVLVFPETTPVGTFRLRARVVYGTGSITGCSSHTWGETHDYTIQIQSNDCPSPKALTTNSTGCDNAVIDWNSNTGSSFVVYGVTGFDPEVTGTYTGIVTSPHIITGLSSGTTYDVYVADTCGNDSSFLHGPHTFATTQGTDASFVTAIGLPSQTARSAYFDASGSEGGTTHEWDFGDGETGSGEYTSHLYKQNGTYLVQLVVSNNCETDTATETIVIEEVGLEDQLLASSLKLYPNPARDRLHYSFSTSGPEVRISLLDYTGRMVLRKDIVGYGESYSGSLDISGLADGVYTLRIQDTDHEVSRQLIKD